MCQESGICFQLCIYAAKTDWTKRPVYQLVIQPPAENCRTQKASIVTLDANTAL
jgi:hypothetical protein